MEVFVRCAQGEITYMTESEQSSDQVRLRKSVWKAINLIQANQLHVHSRTFEIKLSTKNKKTLPEILTICVLNALTPNSAMLLIGGHGGGKTSLVKILGRMFTGLSLHQVEEGIIRGHPQLTEEKMIGTLKIAKLLKEGTEEVVWRDFIKQFWKIVDEVNRLTPYAQDILLSLLAEGRVKYYDAVMEIPQYCLYATINPQDVGTFDLSLPFLDRFGIAIPITMPTSHDLSIILDSQDEKYHGYDELVQVPQVLNIPDLMEIWYYVDRVKASREVDDLIHAIVREFSLCDRVDKGNAERLKPGAGLCAGCHFDVAESICNKTESILSVRVAKDLLRYSKALTWLCDLSEVTPNIVLAVAPYVVMHRSRFVDRELNKDPFFGDKLAFARHLIEHVRKKFLNRADCYDVVQKFREGKGDPADFKSLTNYEKNDLIVKHDLLPLAESLRNDAYVEVVHRIEDNKSNVKELTKLQQTLLEDLEFPNRGDLIARINNLMFSQTLRSFIMPFKVWAFLWPRLALQFPEIEDTLKKTVGPDHLINKQVRTEQMVMRIHIWGEGTKAQVNIELFGGKDALKAAEITEHALKEDVYEVPDLLDELESDDDKKASR